LDFQWVEIIALVCRNFCWTGLRALQNHLPPNWTFGNPGS